MLYQNGNAQASADLEDLIYECKEVSASER